MLFVAVAAFYLTYVSLPAAAKNVFKTHHSCNLSTILLFVDIGWRQTSLC